MTTPDDTPTITTAIITLDPAREALAAFDQVAAGLEVLEEKYAGAIYPVETTAGMKEAKAARGVLKSRRTKLEDMRKAAKRPLIDLGKQIQGQADTIKDRIVAIEQPIDEQIKTREAELRQKKEDKERAEQERLAQIERERLAAQEAELAEQRKELEAEKAKIAAEQKRVAAELAEQERLADEARAAEEAKAAAERAEQERQAAEKRKA